MRELTQGELLVGRYTLVRQLSAGGMGTTWLADDQRSDSRVVLKFANQPAAAEPLQKEWRIASRLMHANIIRVFEFHDEPDGAFYAMQYLQGGDISAIAGLDPSVVLRPIGLLADALRYAHAKELVHRDVKAANVHIDTRGTPYLIDFGVAGVSGDSTRGGGSPAAMSPQQAAGNPPASSDDIYALGVLMVELLTGQPPPTDLSTLRAADGSALPSAIVDLLHDMLAESPAARPNAETVRERLIDAGFAPGPAPASALSGVEQASETLTAQRVRPVARPQARPQQQPTESGKGGISAGLVFGALGGLIVLFVGLIWLLPSGNEQPTDDETTVPVAEEESTEPTDEESVAEGEEPGTEFDLELEDGADDAATFDDGPAGFSENVEDTGATTEEQIKAATDEALGDLLSQLERLRFRAVERWGGQQYLDVVNDSEEGDRAYIARDYREAYRYYRRATSRLEPLFDRVDQEFDNAMAAGEDAFERLDYINAVRSYDLAVAITPGNARAEAALDRAKNLKSVLDLVAQGEQFETDLEYDAAKIAFEQALDLDSLWQPAKDGLARIEAAIKNFSFEQRMTEGLDALAAYDFASARAAFEAAKRINPGSSQPDDGLMQVDQGIRLEKIQSLEMQAQQLEDGEEWETAIDVYEQILAVDGDLQFAQEGAANARARSALHNKIDTFINNPDELSKTRTMQSATNTLLEINRVSPMGPRLEEQKQTVTRLLKRAATPLNVIFMSDNQTEVAINRVARLGVFESQELSMKPGVYVATGSRPGYRDVRIEFRVAPELDMQPIVVQCEEQI